MTNYSNPYFEPKFEIYDVVCVNIDKNVGQIAAIKIADDGVYYEILMDDPRFFCTVHESKVDFLKNK